MLKFLKGLMNPAAPSVPAPASGAADAAAPVSAAREADFRAWLELLLAALEGPERTRLADACIEAAWQGTPSAEALLQGLMEQQRGQWVLMQVDWKASDEVEWQAREMAAAQGIAEVFSWSAANRADARVIDGLTAFEAWLRPRGRRFLFLALDDDAYHGVVVVDALEGPVLEGAAALAVRLLRGDDFRRAQDEG